MSGPSGTFTTPNYPNEYGNNEDCTWTITVAADKVINFEKTSGTTFSTQPCPNCAYDYMSINARRYCGSSFDIVQTDTNYAIVKFISNYAYAYPGFSITYTAVDVGAGGVTYVCEDWYDCTDLVQYCSESASVVEMCAASCGAC